MRRRRALRTSCTTKSRFFFLGLHFSHRWPGDRSIAQHPAIALLADQFDDTGLRQRANALRRSVRADTSSARSRLKAAGCDAP